MNRDDASRRVMKAIAAKNPQVHVPCGAENGTRPIVVSLPSDLISDVIARVQSIGGHSNMDVAFASSFYLIALESSAGARTVAESKVTQDILMGVLLPKLQKHPNTSVRLRSRNSETETPSSQQELPTFI